MSKQTIGREVKNIFMIIVASVLFGLGFDLFLEPANINCGGVAGIAMIVKQLLGKDTIWGISTVALLSFAINLPLLVFSFRAIGRQFVLGSLLCTALISLFLQVFYPLEITLVRMDDRLMNAIFGGVLIGASVGIAFAVGSSTGGTVIAARLLKLKFRNFQIGQLTMAVDFLVILATGIVYRDLTSILYSAVALYVSSLMIDAVVYRFDYSKVVLIITDKYEEVANAIDRELHRGVTMLNAQGHYRREDKFVLLSAVKRHQLAELQQLVNRIDDHAFIIVQEAHQVLGDGFKHYSENSL